MYRRRPTWSCRLVTKDDDETIWYINNKKSLLTRLNTLFNVVFFFFYLFKLTSACEVVWNCKQRIKLHKLKLGVDTIRLKVELGTTFWEIIYREMVLLFYIYLPIVRTTKLSSSFSGDGRRSERKYDGARDNFIRAHRTNLTASYGIISFKRNLGLQYKCFSLWKKFTVMATI